MIVDFDSSIFGLDLGSRRREPLRPKQFLEDVKAETPTGKILDVEDGAGPGEGEATPLHLFLSGAEEEGLRLIKTSTSSEYCLIMPEQGTLTIGAGLRLDEKGK